MLVSNMKQILCSEAGKMCSGLSTLFLHKLNFLDNFDDGVAKSYRRQSKQRKDKQRSYVYCATDTGGFLFWLLN